MRTRKVCGAWPRKTVERAISILQLIRITRAAKDVELRSPARECPQCHQRVELVVLPERICATCWSQKVIGAWQVGPEKVRK